MSTKTRKRGARNRTSTDVGRRIVEGLTELRDTLRDGIPLEQRFTVRTVKVADPEDFDARRVRVLRDRIGVSQGVFAKLLGVSTVLVQSWEQGVREPSPLARRLLAEIARDPRRWQRMVLAAPVRTTRKSA